LWGRDNDGLPQKKPDHGVERQADDIGTGAFDGPDQKGTEFLNAIGAGLVKGFARPDITLEDVVGNVGKG